MKVREMIDKLQRLHPDDELYVYDTDYGYDEVADIELRKVGLLTTTDIWVII